jgi:hypothetical protein
MAPTFQELEKDLSKSVREAEGELRDQEEYREEKKELWKVRNHIKTQVLENFNEVREIVLSEGDFSLMEDAQRGEKILNFLTYGRIVRSFEVDLGRYDYGERDFSKYFPITPYAQNVPKGERGDFILWELGFSIPVDYFLSMFPRIYTNLDKDVSVGSPKKWDGSYPLVMTEDGEDVVLRVSFCKEAPGEGIGLEEALEYSREVSE